MATDKPRFSVTFTQEAFERIQEYQREHNISTQSKAVASLVDLAMAELEGKKSAPAGSRGSSGEERVSLEESNRLLSALGLISAERQLSDEDLAFLTHVVGLLDAWFGQAPPS